MKKRIKKLLKENKTIILTKPSDIFYFTNFYNSENIAIVIIDKSKKYFITDGRFKNQAEKEIKNYEIIIAPQIFIKANEIIKNNNFNNLLLSYKEISYQNYIELTKDVNVQIEDINNLINNLRIKKNKQEIKYIKKACRIAETSFKKTIKYIKPGITEIQIKDILEKEMEKRGSDYPAFKTIVASGPINGALPHAVPTNRKIKKGDFVTIDFGATYNNYCSDITRTIAVGKISKTQKEIYKTVLKAKGEAEKQLKVGVNINKIHDAAEAVINNAGYKFLHSIGHGLGIDIHEAPGLNTKNRDKLLNKTVHTIEPGIYEPNICGVRIEDDYLITKKGYKKLTNKITTDLIIL